MSQFLRAVISGAIAGVTALSLIGCAGGGVESANGPLDYSQSRGVACGPMSFYRKGAISLPVEPDQGILISRVEVSAVDNARVSRVGAGHLKDLPLLATSRGTSMPLWASYHATSKVDHAHPGQVVAMYEVIDPRKKAQLGPFVIHYSEGGRKYVARGGILYTVSVTHC